MKQIKIEVNGETHELLVKPSATLLDIIREDLALTGTKEGCGIGECGACTVIIDGETVNACLILAVEADGKQITTIEGLARGDVLHPILSAKALLDRNGNPTDEEIRKGLEGNFCRCTGYTKIIESVKVAAQKMSGQ
jgi:carbon-monoxide dehydrogenase small subunit